MIIRGGFDLAKLSKDEYNIIARQIKEVMDDDKYAILMLRRHNAKRPMGKCPKGVLTEVIKYL